MGIAAVGTGAADKLFAQTSAAVTQPAEEYLVEPLPPGFQVHFNEFEGAVFADDTGRTLYRWPGGALRNGLAGERKGAPACGDEKSTKTAGLLSPYPGGMELPELDKRPTCTQMWPPVLAADDAKEVGNWSVVTRKDGKKQWAYEGLAVYASALDKSPGDAFGGTKRRLYASVYGAVREVVGPKPAVPPQFDIQHLLTGHLLTMRTGFSVYASQNDEPNESHCFDACLEEWVPVAAPAGIAQVGRDWSAFERAPGLYQWAYQKMPLYTRVKDRQTASMEGSDAPGWSNVYTLPAPTPPAEFSTRDTVGGEVLADSKGMTIYIYSCNDDAVDQLACDYPGGPQEYRWAVCGHGDPGRCLEMFPYVIPTAGAKSPNKTWTIMSIDPVTGDVADAADEQAVQVWAYRGRPVYRHGRDRKPGEVNGDAWGEFEGRRNGYKAFWLRDDFAANVTAEFEP